MTKSPQQSCAWGLVPADPHFALYPTHSFTRIFPRLLYVAPSFGPQSHTTHSSTYCLTGGPRSTCEYVYQNAVRTVDFGLFLAFMVPRCATLVLRRVCISASSNKRIALQPTPTNDFGQIEHKQLLWYYPAHKTSQQKYLMTWTYGITMHNAHTAQEWSGSRSYFVYCLYVLLDCMPWDDSLTAKQHRFSRVLQVTEEIFAASVKMFDEKKLLEHCNPCNSRDP